MPLTAKGEKIMANMKEQYGSDKKAKEVFYASKNAGKISGVDSMDAMTKVADGVGKLVERFDSFLVRRRAGFKTRHDAARSDATIYEALKSKLGREPSGAELKAEVQRIKEEGLKEAAEKGKLPHQRRR